MSWFTKLFKSEKRKRRFSEPRFVTYRCHRITCSACGKPFEDGETLVCIEAIDEGWLQLTHLKCQQFHGSAASSGDVDAYELPEWALNRLAAHGFQGGRR